jgi:hypothetical protein
MTDEHPTHLIILRACDADTEGRNAEARIDHVGEPDQKTLDNYRRGIIDMFVAGFDKKPERVGVAVLPWSGELDDEAGNFSPDEEGED